MERKYIILFLAFLGSFIFVLWCFPGEKKEKEDKVPYWFRFFMPMADLFAQDAGEWLSSVFIEYSTRLRRWGNDSGLQWLPARIIGLQIAMMLTTLIFVSIFLFMVDVSLFYSVWLIAALMILAAVLPVMVVIKLAKTRTAEISRILPFAIDLISSAMNAGLDFTSAVRYYTALEFQDSLSKEFNVLLSEIELGKSKSEALRNMMDRVKSDEFSRFVSAIAYSLESGAAIIDVMQIQADEVRRLRFVRLENENAKVPSKMLVPIILCIVPAVFITVLVPIILSIKDISLFTIISQKGIW